VYRRHLLTGLKELLADVASRRSTPIDLREALAIRTLREWDGRVVAARFGFRSAEHYYAEESAGPRLSAISIPSLLIATEADPMVPAHTLRPSLREAPPALQVKWLDLGGHVGFPKHVKVGEGATAAGLERQVIDWLAAR
jgi:predicted alpha/beta-fold hydrolase